ncbi:MAG TPA: hypothetical protein VE008_07430 [Burkholderiales bacterium]|nr:hypothetical protein [Burkholderiales bacterium]
MRYHNAEAVLERLPIAELERRGWPMSEGRPVHTIDTIPKSDPRWPAQCACGYTFAESDAWQCNPSTLYRRADTGELMLLGRAPVGAMWNADWMADGGGPWRVVDGICLCVRTPGGEWCVDGPAWSDGKMQAERGWTRSGAVPDVTANPSILIPGKYHGFLRAGWLEEC